MQYDFFVQNSFIKSLPINFFNKTREKICFGVHAVNSIVERILIQVYEIFVTDLHRWSYQDFVPGRARKVTLQYSVHLLMIFKNKIEYYYKREKVPFRKLFSFWWRKYDISLVTHFAKISCSFPTLADNDNLWRVKNKLSMPGQTIV